MSIRDTLERVRVSADFTDADGRRLAGRYFTRIDSRLTSTAGDGTVIPAGLVPSARGHLSTDESRRSLDIRVPATDDPEIREDGWRVSITVVFCDRRASEVYTLEVIPAGGEIDLADVVPATFPKGGQVPASPVIIHGEDGVGVESITYDAHAGALVFLLTDGTTIEVELPGASQPGEPGGRGIEEITAEGTTATVLYTDGGTDTFELPRGLQGEPGRDGVDGAPGDPGRDGVDGAPGRDGVDGVDGRGIEGIAAEDTTATVTYTDGGTGTFELPRGPQGAPGSDGADGSPGRDGVDGAPGEPGRDGVDGTDGRGVEGITAVDTTATVTYTDGGTGTFELPRGPQGERGLQGARGPAGADGTTAGPWMGLTPELNWSNYVGGGDYPGGAFRRAVSGGIQIKMMMRHSGGTIYKPITNYDPLNEYPNKQAHQVVGVANSNTPVLIYCRSSGMIELLTYPSTINFISATFTIPRRGHPGPARAGAPRLAPCPRPPRS